MNNSLPSDSQDLERRAETLLDHVRTLIVRDAETAGRAGTLARLGAAMEREIHDQWDPICRAADEAHTVAVRQRAKLLAFPNEIKRLAGAKVTEWQREQGRIRREVEEQARLERERLQHAERDRVAEANSRLYRDLEERRLTAALQAEQRGDTKAAEEILATPIVAPTIAERPVFVAPEPTPEPVTIPGITAREEWDFRVVDADVIPRAYLVPDDVALRRVVRALKDKAQIPGIEVYVRVGAAVRRA